MNDSSPGVTFSLPHEFAMVESGFPTDVRIINPFQKVKVERSVVAVRYQRAIDAIYSTAGTGGKL